MASARAIQINTCRGCNSTFHPWNTNLSAPYCSRECSSRCRQRRVWKTCEICSERFECLQSQAKRYNVRFCGRRCKGVGDRMRLSGDGAPWYKGGWINPSGYRVISVDSRKYLEHRYVMQQHVGRSLRDDEVVHHQNGNKLDNSIENLQLMSYADHMKLHWSTGHYADRGKK